MTLKHLELEFRQRAVRRLDVASLILLLIGLAFGALAYWLIEDHSANALLIVPSTVSATLASSHLVKRQVLRDRDHFGCPRACLNEDVHKARANYCAGGWDQR